MDARTERIAKNLAVLESRWNGLILLSLMGGKLRFRALLGRIDGITDAMLAKRLRELEDDELVRRERREAEVWYALTKKAVGVKSVLDALANWKRR